MSMTESRQSPDVPEIYRKYSSSRRISENSKDRTTKVSAKSNLIDDTQEDNASVEGLIRFTREGLMRRHEIARKMDELKLEQLVPIAEAELDNLLSCLEKGAIPQAMPERPRFAGLPPFSWVPSPDYTNKFKVSGANREVVVKLDKGEAGWVTPCAGSMKMLCGGLYRWTIQILSVNPMRPQMQIGVHGERHAKPWRLITTTRCSFAGDDGIWQDRAEGDLPLQEGDYMHIQCDFRDPQGIRLGSLSFAVNDGPFELVSADIPLSDGLSPLVPVVSMGAPGSAVRVCPM